MVNKDMLLRRPITMARFASLLICSIFLSIQSGCYQPDAKTQAYQDALSLISNGTPAQLNAYLKKNPFLIHYRDNFDQSTLLHAATVNRQRKEIVEVLLDAGFAPNAVDVTGRSPLHNSYKFHGEPEVQELLIQRGADESLKDGYGKVPADYYDPIVIIDHLATDAPADGSSTDAEAKR